jgi:hypothetical protein
MTQIGLGNLQIDGRLPICFVSGVENPESRFFVSRLEAFLFASGVVLNEKDPAASAEKSIFAFHRHPEFQGCPVLNEPR